MKIVHQLKRRNEVKIIKFSNSSLFLNLDHELFEKDDFFLFKD